VKQGSLGSIPSPGTMEKHYDPNLFEVEVKLKLLVTASNAAHAISRLGVLLDSRITQYVHPEDTQPQFKVIAVVTQKEVLGIPERKVIVERHTEGPKINDEKKGSSGFISPRD
jgi:hypothetical protein